MDSIDAAFNYIRNCDSAGKPIEYPKIRDLLNKIEGDIERDYVKSEPTSIEEILEEFIREYDFWDEWPDCVRRDELFTTYADKIRRMVD